MNPVKEMALTRHILETAAGHPDRVAFCVGEKRLSYRELVKGARHQAEVLSAWRRYHPPIIPGDQGLRLPVLLLGCLLSRRPYVVRELSSRFSPPSTRMSGLTKTGSAGKSTTSLTAAWRGSWFLALTGSFTRWKRMR